MARSHQALNCSVRWPISIVVAAPFDVIKVRIQSRPFDSPESGFSIVRKLIANEGPIALFKGLVSPARQYYLCILRCAKSSIYRC